MWSNEHRVQVIGLATCEVGLRCQCGWNQEFGYTPSPNQLVQGEFDHLREALGGLTGKMVVKNQYEEITREFPKKLPEGTIVFERPA